MKNRRNGILGIAVVLLLGTVAARADSFTVNWNNDSGTKLFNLDGTTPLSQGNATSNNDGVLIQLGYFAGANPAINNFLGTWTPLTGATAIGRTTIGDSADLSGAGAGIFQFNTFFNTGSNNVDVYISGLDDGAYTTHSLNTITSALPANNQVLSIRFYNTNTGGVGSNYNTVSDDAWVWHTPDNTSITNINLTNAGLEWEDPTHTFAVSPLLTVTAVPEPSTYASALLGLGGLGLATLRRRLKK